MRALSLRSNRDPQHNVQSHCITRRLTSTCQLIDIQMRTVLSPSLTILAMTFQLCI